jgi:hypothetical protein
MPDFGLSRQQAQQLVDGLWLASARASSPTAAVSDTSPPPAAGELERAPEQLKLGEQLLHSVGCLACHSWHDIGSESLWGGGPLERIGTKRTAEFLNAWLTSPTQVRPESRMPTVDLTAEERSALITFMTYDHDQTDRSSEPLEHPSSPASMAIDQAAALIQRTGCGECHQLPVAIVENMPADIRPPASARRPIRHHALSDLDRHRSCLGAPAPLRGRPGYRLPDQVSRDIVAYLLMATQDHPLEWSAPLGTEHLLLQQHCLACHPRGLGSGIAETAEHVHQRFPMLGESLAALVPPSLNRIGDKLHAEVLAGQISGDQPPLRPWLSVRMPRYQLDDHQLRQLIDGLIERDRPPELPASLQQLMTGQSKPPSDQPPLDLDATAVRSLGGRLVTSGGLGCASCHSIGPVAAPPAPIGARGPNLARLDRRVRREWFDRWVANPLRMVPRVEMPSITTAVPGLLDEQLDQQLDVIWQALALPDFSPPRPNPVRQLRRSGYADDRQASLVIQDLLRADQRRWTKPLLIGLPNRHNLVFDVQSASLDGWWLGDTVNQYTEGKNWYWEAAGSNLWSTEPPQPQLRLAAPVDGAGEGRPLLPIPQGQFIAQLDGWEHDRATAGVRFWYRLLFEDRRLPATGSATVRVTETWEPVWEADNGLTIAPKSGWRRRLQVEGVPDGWQPELRRLPRPPQPLVDAADQRLEHLSGVDPDSWVALDMETSETVLIYSTSVLNDRFPITNRPPTVRPQTPLTVVPGFNGYELPLPPEIMPTGMSWQNENTLLVTDLKGSIWQVDWPSSPGGAAHAVEVADQLSTPFGIAAYRDYLDVSTKSGLLRLRRSTPGPRYDRVEVVADGWGHTDDYHDWAVGLVQRDGGEYFLALSCQQDRRSPAEAYLRGHVVRLIPRAASKELPRQFQVESYTRGHRFPIGIASHPDLGIFVTDNQGHYKPFNELNRLEAGQHYGFINALQRGEPQPDRQSAAVHIPHPWTRSVNGISFLRSPVDPSLNERHFGPLEGHLIGCEYDTRRLIRMTLQQVDGLWQGAAYPFSLPPPPDALGLRGPITCSVSPQGDLVIGNLRETGWGTGTNDGALVRLRLASDQLPAGILEMRVVHDGFLLHLNGPIDPKRAVDPQRFRLDSYTREATPQYGGADQQRRQETIAGIGYEADRQLVHVRVERLRPGFVYELSLESLAPEGEPFFPAEAHYTLHAIPR